MLRTFIFGAAALATSATALPSAAEAQSRYRDYGYSRNYDGYSYDRGYRNYDRRYRDYGRYERGYRDYRGDRYRRCSDGTTGAIVGGAAGALLGREIARGGGRSRYHYRNRGGDGTTGAILGGAIGALIGNEIGKNC